MFASLFGRVVMGAVCGTAAAPEARWRRCSWTLVADACRGDKAALGTQARSSRRVVPAAAPSVPAGGVLPGAPVFVCAPVQEVTAAFHNATGTWWAAPAVAPTLATLLRRVFGCKAVRSSSWPWFADNQWRKTPNDALAIFDRVVFVMTGAMIACPPTDNAADAGGLAAAKLLLPAPCLVFVPRQWTLANSPQKSHTVHLSARVTEA